MEVKNVTFTGLGVSVSDLMMPDGELSISHNIHNEYGSMRPVWIPEDVMALDDGEVLKYIHTTPEYKNYIVGKRTKPVNGIVVYHKYDDTEGYGTVNVVLTYPAVDAVNVYVKVAETETGESYELVMVFAAGESGKKTLTLPKYDEAGVVTKFSGARYETEDTYYAYGLTTMDDSDGASESAVWHDEVPASSYSLLYFTDADGTRRKLMSVPAMDESVKLESIGNTLIVTSGNGLEYVLYKSGAYKNLGQKPPELDVQWMLELSVFFASGAVDVGENNYKYVIPSDKELDVGAQVAAVVNKAIADNEADNWFTSTFYVRWAYRMYNGAYMASPPVMMPLNGGTFPLMRATSDNIALGTDNLTEFDVSVFGYKGQLRFKIPNYEAYVKSQLEKWSDVVDGIDIYVTRGISKFDQNGAVTGITSNQSQDSCISYGRRSRSSTTSLYVRNVFSADSDNYWLEGMQKSDSEYQDELKSQGVFYKLKSYKVADLSGEMDVVLPEKAVTNLTTGEVLGNETDEYLEHDKLYADGMMIYNRRLNLYGVKSEKYNFPASALMAYTDGVVSSESGGDDVEKGYMYIVRFVIGSEGGDVGVTGIDTSFKLYEPPLYLFYPDNNAKKAIIQRYDYSDPHFEQATVVLSSHPTLQGCYWFGGFNRLEFTDIDTSEVLDLEPSSMRLVPNGSKIYTSEVDNPFVFPLGGINTIGTGTVIGISTATQALSQGQFGQFPLYVFSSDGIWAMEVGSDGLFSSVKPVSRDVCVNGNSITQTDNAVVFVTNKGVMMIGGSEVVCLSEPMNGRGLDADDVGSLRSVFEKEGLPPCLLDMVGFVDYVKDAGIAYDGANKRMLVYRSGSVCSYVYSMVSGTWATVTYGVDSLVNSYPDVYLQTGDKVKRFSDHVDYSDVREVKTLLVTRPLKLDTEGYKGVREVVVRGTMGREDVSIVLWGSREGDRYVPIGSVKGARLYRIGGTGYRYFRIGIVGNLRMGDKIDLASVGFLRKYDKHLR